MIWGENPPFLETSILGNISAIFFTHMSSASASRDMAWVYNAGSMVRSGHPNKFLGFVWWPLNSADLMLHRFYTLEINM